MATTYNERVKQMDIDTLLHELATATTAKATTELCSDTWERASAAIITLTTEIKRRIAN